MSYDNVSNSFRTALLEDDEELFEFLTTEWDHVVEYMCNTSQEH